MLYYITYGFLDIILASSIWTISKTLKGAKYLFKNRQSMTYINNNNEYDLIVIDNDLEFITRKQLDNSIKLDKILKILEKNLK